MSIKLDVKSFIHLLGFLAIGCIVIYGLNLDATDDGGTIVFIFTAAIGVWFGVCHSRVNSDVSEKSQ